MFRSIQNDSHRQDLSHTHIRFDRGTVGRIHEWTDIDRREEARGLEFACGEYHQGGDVLVVVAVACGRYNVM